jgi:hypothetical protein
MSLLYNYGKQRFLTDLSLNGTTELTGQAILSGSTTISGATTISGSTTHTAATTFSGAGKTQFNADASFNQALTIAGATTVSGKSQFNADVSLNGITTAGKTQFISDVSLNGHITTTVDGKRFTSTGNSRFTSADTFATYLNNDKATSGDLYINSGSLNSNVIVQNGNVGIGTTNPTAKLDVRGIAYISDKLTVNNGISMLDKKIDLHNSDGYHYIQYQTDGVRDGPKIAGYQGGALGSSSTDIFVPALTWWAGNVGIGKTDPGTTLDVYGRIRCNGPNPFQMINTRDSVNTSNYIDIYDYNNVGRALFGVDGTGMMGSTNRGATLLGSWTNHPVIIAANASEKMRITSDGNVGIGITNPNCPFMVRQPTYDLTGGTLIADFVMSTESVFRVYTGGWLEGASASTSGRNAVLRVGRANTERSISSSGTNNASGNDYAEYMRKKDNTFTINKGDICGIDASGNLTNLYDEAYSFVVKSTLPSFVGGDNWYDPSDNMPDISNNEAYTAWEIRGEARRALVDRIAFCGQVPVNIDTTNVKVGDHIIPNRTSDGKIEALAVSDPTFVQYKSAVGKVINILSSSKANIIVKIC